MSDDQFTKLFKSIEDVKTQLADVAMNVATKDDVNEVYNRLDDIAARLENDDTERVALMSQVNRHENWIHQLSDKTNTELVTEN